MSEKLQEPVVEVTTEQFIQIIGAKEVERILWMQRAVRAEARLAEIGEARKQEMAKDSKENGNGTCTGN